MNLLELGDLLKREREKRGLSVRDVMESTKISRRNLNALEVGEIKLLPHPVYLKGYVRNYAHMVGLDADPLVAVVEQQSDGESGYIKQVVAPVPVATPVPPVQPAAVINEPADELAVVPQGDGDVEPDVVVSEPAPAASVESTPTPSASSVPEQAVPAAAPSAPPESQIRYSGATSLGGEPPRRVWPWMVLLIIAGIMAVLYVQFRRIEAEVEQKPAPVVAPAPQVNASAANATEEQNATDPANATLPEPAPAPEAAPASAAVAPSASATKALPPQSAAPVVAASPVEVSRKAPAAATEPRTAGMQQLVVTAKSNEACWVELTEGSQRKSVTLRNGDSTRFEFSKKVRIRLGNAGGVNFQLNGAPYPFEGERGATATVEIGTR